MERFSLEEAWRLHIFEGRWQTRWVADGLYKTPSAAGGEVVGIGVVFVVADSSIDVSCLICAAVSFCSRFISSIIIVVALVATVLVAFSGISLRLVWLLLLRPLIDLSSGFYCSKDFVYAVMVL